MRRRTKVMAAVVVLLVVAVAVGVGLWAVGGLQGLGLGPGILNPDRVVVNQGTAPQTYALRGGTYQVTWTHAGCARLRTSIEQVGGDYRRTHGYSGIQNVPTGGEALEAVPAGDYQITQTDGECTTWEITVERTGD